MNAPRIILASLLSFCQTLPKLVEIWRNSVKKKFAQFFLRHGVRCEMPKVQISFSITWSKLQCFATRVDGFKNSQILCLIATWMSDKRVTRYGNQLYLGQMVNNVGWPHITINECTAVDHVMTAMCWCIVLLEDKHISSNAADHWQQLLH